MNIKYFFHDIKNHIHNISLLIQEKLRSHAQLTINELVLLDNEICHLLEVVEDEELTLFNEQCSTIVLPSFYITQAIDHIISLHDLKIKTDLRKEVTNQGVKIPKAVLIRVLENIFCNIKYYGQEKIIESIRYIEIDNYIVIEIKNKLGLQKNIKRGQNIGINSSMSILGKYECELISSAQLDGWTSRLYLKKFVYQIISEQKAA